MFQKWQILNVCCLFLLTGLVTLFWFWDTRAAFLFISLFLNTHTLVQTSECVSRLATWYLVLFFPPTNTYILIWPLAHTYTLMQACKIIQLKCDVEMYFLRSVRKQTLSTHERMNVGVHIQHTQKAHVA